MRRLSFRILDLRLSVVAAGFALGLASANLWTRQGDRQYPPLVVAVRTQSEKGSSDSSESQTCSDDTRVEGRYYDYDFGFSVDLPKGMNGVVMHHSFGIDLDNPQSVRWADGGEFPKSYVSVDAHYNSLEWRSLDEAVRESLSYIEPDPGSKVTLLRKATTSLAGLRAARFVARYTKNGEPMVSDEIVAFRGEGRDVVYTIDLGTPEANYERDKAVVSEMQKTWCLQPLP